MERETKFKRYGGSRRSWPGFLWAGAILMALFLMSCASRAPEAAPTPTSAPTVKVATPTAVAPAVVATATLVPTPVPSTPKLGGQVIVGLRHPTTLNPALTSFSLVVIASPLFYDGLTRPGDNLEPQPALAESWEISSDGLTYTFHLRNGVILSQIPA